MKNSPIGGEIFDFETFLWADGGAFPKICFSWEGKCVRRWCNPPSRLRGAAANPPGRKDRMIVSVAEPPLLLDGVVAIDLRWGVAVCLQSSLVIVASHNYERGVRI